MANEFKARNGVITPVVTATAATGTAPLSVTSTTVCTNLNADLLDGKHASEFVTGATKIPFYLASGTASHINQVLVSGVAYVPFLRASGAAANIPMVL